MKCYNLSDNLKYLLSNQVICNWLLAENNSISFTYLDGENLNYHYEIIL